MKLKEFNERNEKMPFYQKELDERISFNSFIKELNLDIIMGDNTLFIILSFILSFYARRNSEFFPIGIDHKFFSKEIGSSSNGGRQILKQCQKILAGLSINVLKDIAAQQRIDTRLFDALIKIGENNLPCFPCYLGMKLLINAACFEMIPIFLSVKRFFGNEFEILSNIFYVDKATNRYTSILKDASEIDSISQICIAGKIVEKNIYNPSTEYLHRLAQYSIEDILSFNMASHPQFSGELLRKYIDNPYQDLTLSFTELNNYRTALDMYDNELKTKRRKAEKLGFSRDNPTVFALQHVFATATNNSLHSKKKGIKLPLNTKSDTRPISNDLQIFND